MLEQIINKVCLNEAEKNQLRASVYATGVTEDMGKEVIHLVVDLHMVPIRINRIPRPECLN